MSKGNEVQLEDDLIDLCKELHRIKQHAEVLGIFTYDPTRSLMCSDERS